MANTPALTIHRKSSFTSIMGFLSSLFKLTSWECCKCLKRHGITTINPGTAHRCTREAFEDEQGNIVKGCKHLNMWSTEENQAVKCHDCKAKR